MRSNAATTAPKTRSQNFHVLDVEETSDATPPKPKDKPPYKQRKNDKGQKVPTPPTNDNHQTLPDEEQSMIVDPEPHEEANNKVELGRRKRSSSSSDAEPSFGEDDFPPLPTLNPPRTPKPPPTPLPTNRQTESSPAAPPSTQPRTIMPQPTPPSTQPPPLPSTQRPPSPNQGEPPSSPTGQEGTAITPGAIHAQSNRDNNNVDDPQTERAKALEKALQVKEEDRRQKLQKEMLRREATKPEEGKAPPNKFTPAPRLGFTSMIPHGHDSTWHTDNIRGSALSRWARNPTGDGFLIHIEGETSHGPNANYFADVLAETINEHWNIEDTKVVSALPERNAGNSNGPPYAFFVHNITQGVANEILAQQVWHFSSAHFIAYPLDKIPQTFLGAIKGLCPLKDNADMYSIRSELVDIMRDRELPIAHVLNNFIQGVAEGATTFDDYGVQQVADSLVIKRLGTLRKGSTASPSILMYLQYPPLNANDVMWAKLKEAVASTKYELIMHGPGHYTRGWFCTNCHGCDHMHGLCPLRALEDDVAVTRTPPPPPDKPLFEQGSSNGDFKTRGKGRNDAVRGVGRARGGPAHGGR